MNSHHSMVEYQPIIVESYRYYLSVNKSITYCSRDRDMGYHVLSTKVNTTGLGFTFLFVPVYHVYHPQGFRGKHQSTGRSLFLFFPNSKSKDGA